MYIQIIIFTSLTFAVSNIPQIRPQINVRFHFSHTQLRIPSIWLFTYDLVCVSDFGFVCRFASLQVADLIQVRPMKVETSSDAWHMKTVRSSRWSHLWETRILGICICNVAEMFCLFLLMIAQSKYGRIVMGLTCFDYWIDCIAKECCRLLRNGRDTRNLT